jgi:hypothetical protein
MHGLTKAQRTQYREDGYTIRRGLLDAHECDDFKQHMMDLHAGRKQLDGYGHRDPDDWSRTRNQHSYDERALALLIEPRLHPLLMDCLDDEVDAIQTMYFYQGSQWRRHQDQFYIPGCMSAWIALEDAGRRNGSLYAQPGSNRGHLLTPDELYQMDGVHYYDAVDDLFKRNGLPEQVLEVNRGDVILIDGVLIHWGGPILEPGAFRHSMVNHYIRRSFEDWPHTDWWRIGFDGSRRK